MEGSISVAGRWAINTLALTLDTYMPAHSLSLHRGRSMSYVRNCLIGTPSTVCETQAGGMVTFLALAA